LVVQYDLTFGEDPYDTKTMDALESMMNEGNELLADADLNGELYFAGETAASVDNRNVNNRDLIVIVIVETILIFGMLIFLTKSVSVSAIDISTTVLACIGGLRVGTILRGFIFDVHSISKRVPVYAIVFVVALVIDYNILLVARYLGEKKHYPVKEAVSRA